MDLLDRALAFAAAGYSVVPTRPDGTKAPAAYWKTYQDQRATDDQVRAWLGAGAHDGIGLVCGTVSGNLELLELEGRAVTEGLVPQLAALLADNGLADVWARLNSGYLELTPSGGLHWLYRVDGAPARNLKLARRPATPAELADNPGDRVKVLAETRGEGGYVVVAPSNGRTHDTGKAWTLLAGGVAFIPTLTVDERDQLHAVAAMLDQMPAADPVRAATGPAGEATGDRPGDDYNASADWQDILGPHGWTRIRPLGHGWTWRRPGKDRGISATTGTRGTGHQDRLYVFSSSTVFSTETPYSKFGARALLEHDGDHAAAARALRRSGYGKSTPPVPPVDPATLIAPTPASDNMVAKPAAITVIDTVDLDPLPAEPWSELGYAHRLAHVYGTQLRYVPVWNRWFTWDGRRWAHDTTGQVDRWAKTIARAVMHTAQLVDDEKARKAAIASARSAESSRGVRGALTLAGTIAGIALDPTDLDADPWLLNCRNGVLDLRTGELGPHDPALLLTKLTGTAYDPDATGTEFARFLGRIQPQEEMRAFLARLLGHALPGTVVEHLLPILHGAGANGKSTLIDAVCFALGDYAGTAEPGIFLDRGFDAHPTGVADLFGRRLVIVHESDSGRHLAEGTVKRLTGGDRIKARRMREDFWEFEPSHTAFMLTNHQPIVRGTDEAMWRRLRMVPFDVTIPVDERDGELGEKLRLELSAILAWLVNGYQDWRGNGLAEPEQVVEATGKYRAESDVIGRFLNNRCLLGPHWNVPSTELYTAYTDWCRAEGIEQETQRALATALQSRGLDNQKDRTGRIRWHGIGLASDAPDGDGE